MTTEPTVRYDGLTEPLPLEQHSLYRKIDRIVRELPPGRVLEVGCLDGRFLARLRDRGWSVAGIDLVPNAAPYVVRHDASQPFPFGREFDLVIAAEVIEHVAGTDAFLANCSAVLKPGGTLILTTPNLLFGVNRLLMLLGKTPRIAYADYHLRMFVWADLREKIARRFRIERVQGSHVLLGMRRGRAAEVFARLGDRWPTLSAHFIVTATTLDIAPTPPEEAR
ncbi:MAG TPA: class I SAM-dependent methyltransferase [Dehalococcoidia bacterium]|nr:class I SAM-dependent methyltransferase [Dehalococcoidia bacterium]